MARRWKWYLRQGLVDLAGPPARVDAPAGSPAAVASLNEAAVYARITVDSEAVARARAASWRWPA